jgi:hypothetical protein
MDYEKEYKKVKKELEDVKSIQPNDNVNYLIRQFDYGNFTTNEKEKVLNILKRAEDGIKMLTSKLHTKIKINKK